MSTSLVSLASLVSAFSPVIPQLRVAAIILRGDALLLVEHLPVYTVGEASRSITPCFLQHPLFQIERGGDMTYHGPGQLVGYPIVRIDDVASYVRALEEALVAALAEEGVSAHGRSDEGDRKSTRLNSSHRSLSRMPSSA